MFVTEGSQLWLLNQFPEGKIGNLFLKRVPQVILMLQRSHVLEPPFGIIHFKGVIYWYGAIQDKAGLLGGKWTHEWGKLFSCPGVFYKNSLLPKEVSCLGLKLQRSEYTLTLRSKSERFHNSEVLAFWKGSKSCQCPTHMPWDPMSLTIRQLTQLKGWEAILGNQCVQEHPNDGWGCWW